MKHALITGATGFIGFHLVKELTEQSTKVTCLIRSTSDHSVLDEFGPQYLIGDVTDRASLQSAISDCDCDVVFHLAGLTKSLSGAELMRVNEIGTANVAACCAEAAKPPTLIVVSSLSAAGPTPKSGERLGPYTERTVSDYGKSKRAGEKAALKHAGNVPITILRPPIVLGQGDGDGLTMYSTIKRFRVHLVPCLFDNHYSVIHASDLAKAAFLAATKCKRVNYEDPSEGIYYVAAEQQYTYAGLGRVIAAALGRKVMMIRFPSPLVWVVAAGGEIVGRIKQKPSLLNIDKAREATAGSWTCSGQRFAEETGFKPAKTFPQQVRDTVDWYRKRGWL